MEDELIKLKNSNALSKFPVDADELNYNFKYLDNKTGVPALKTFIESVGMQYFPENTGQLALSVAQYIASSGIYSDVSSSDAYQLESIDGKYIPLKCTEGMVITFKPTHTNIGASTIQFSTDETTRYPIYAYGKEIAPGYMPVGSFISFILRTNTDQSSYGSQEFYWERTITPISSSVEESASSGSEDPTINYATIAIKNTVESTKLLFDSANYDTLSEAISRYAVSICYKATYLAGLYTLSPKTDTFASPSTYFDGMLVAFICPNTNNTDSLSIKLVNANATVPLVGYDGNNIASGTLHTGQFIIAVYDQTHGKFNIISNYIPNLVLGDGNTLSGITSDGTLASGSTTLAASVPAIKEYVDSHIKGSYANTITSGYTTDSGYPAAVSLSGEHEICLVAGQNSFRENTPNDPSTSTIVSSNSSIAYRAVDLIDSTYWESANSGFIVDDVVRVVKVQSDESKTLLQKYSGDPLSPVYYNNPPSPEYFGLRNIPHTTTHLRVKFPGVNYAPNKADIQVLLPIGDGGTSEWTSVCTPDGTMCEITLDQVEYDTEIDILKEFVFEYAAPGSTQTVPVVYYYGSNGSEENVPIPYEITTNFELDVRLRILVFDQQDLAPNALDSYADGATYNVASSSDVKRPLRISYFQVGSLVDAPNFEFSYPNATRGALFTQAKFTQYVISSIGQNNVPVSSLETYDDGDYVCFIQDESTFLQVIKKSHIIKQSTFPQPSSSYDGYVLYNTITTTPDTYRCVVSGDNQYSWEKHDILPVATVVFANNAITHLENYGYGTEVSEVFNALPTMETLIEHNFGTNVKCRCILECCDTNGDLGYEFGEKIELSQHVSTSYSLLSADVTKLVYDADPSTQTSVQIGEVNVKEYSLVSEISFVVMVTNEMDAKIKIQNLKLPDLRTSSGTPTPISPNKWKLIVYVNKE